MLYLREVQSLYFSHDLLLGKEEAILAILICMRVQILQAFTTRDESLHVKLSLTSYFNRQHTKCVPFRSEMSPPSMPVLIGGKIEVTSYHLLRFDMAPHAAKAESASHTFIGGWREVWHPSVLSRARIQATEDCESETLDNHSSTTMADSVLIPNEGWE
jgi:hypothetical protein